MCPSPLPLPGVGAALGPSCLADLQDHFLGLNVFFGQGFGSRGDGRTRRCVNLYGAAVLVCGRARASPTKKLPVSFLATGSLHLQSNGAA